MPRLIWSQHALLDVQRLYRFLAEKNNDAARRAVKIIREGVIIIARQPAIGRPVEEMDPEYREWLIDFGGSGYVVLYHFNMREAVILAVRHQREAGWDQLQQPRPYVANYFTLATHTIPVQPLLNACDFELAVPGNKEGTAVNCPFDDEPLGVVEFPIGLS